MTAKLIRAAVLAFLAIPLAGLPAKAETPEEWVELGARLHGFFGGFIPVGIRIGLDAKERLKSDPRGLSILYYQGEKAPCPCIVDGVMLATQASPGQGTEEIAKERAPDGALAVIIIRNRKTGEALRYTIADVWLAKILAWNRFEPVSRYDKAMTAVGLFTVEPFVGR